MIVLQNCINYICENPQEFIFKIITQLKLSYYALFTALIISIPLGILCSKKIMMSKIVINFINSIRVIPSLAIVAILIPILKTGFKPSLIALIILGIPPILANTYAGFKCINKKITESAKGMGMNNLQILFKIEFPLALPIILTGSKIAAVEVIASSTLAAFIGGGGLGEYIISGVSMMDTTLILVGTIPLCILVLLTELILDKLASFFVNEKKRDRRKKRRKFCLRKI